MKKINKKNAPKEFEVRKAAIYATHRKTRAESENEKSGKFNAYEELREADKEILRPALAQEQGYICVYCEKELTVNKQMPELKSDLVIEHFRPESIYQGRVNTTAEVKFLCDDLVKFRKDLTLDYNNLFLSCNGNSGAEAHCDASKKNYDFCHLSNPSTWSITDERKIKFTKNGIITSSDKAIIPELEGRKNKEGASVEPHYLNLNDVKLMELRRKTWKGVAKEIAKKTGLKDWEKGGDEVLKVISEFRLLYKNGKRVGDKVYHKPFRSFVLYYLEKRLRGRL